MTRKIFTPDFLIIPYQLLESEELQKTDLLVYAVIYWFHHMKDGKCTASNRTIAKYTKTTSNTVVNCLTRLERGGFIARIFDDEHKRERKQIIPLIHYGVKGYHPQMEGVPSTDGGGVPSTDGQISNNKISNNYKLSADAEDGKDSKEEEVEWSLEQELTRLRDSNRKDYKIIALYMVTKKYTFDNKEQYLSMFKRCLKPASLLKGYGGKDISRTIKHCQDNYEEWTFETVAKRIADVINT